MLTKMLTKPCPNRPNVDQIWSTFWPKSFRMSGGGGSRTRVRNYSARRIYVRVQFVWVSRRSIKNRQEC